ncbi:unnamed protein product [Brassica oleracea]|uniref:(rape) hypothetical protein n=1 Tax=Brassica napus TaxID=3708 RepID=A0A816JTT5_BRANA|nr:unnamed protein product [Brassica napus]
MCLNYCEVVLVFFIFYLLQVCMYYVTLCLLSQT